MFGLSSNARMVLNEMVYDPNGSNNSSLLTSACRSLNVVFAMDRAGLVGDDGPTHHGAFDIAYLRCLPNIVLMAPRDEAMLVHMLRTALARTTARSPCATRAAKAWACPCRGEPQPIAIGTGEILREGGAARPPAGASR